MNDYLNSVQALVNLGIAPEVALQAIENESQRQENERQRAHQRGDDLYIFL
jgi:hypothetical protein